MGQVPARWLRPLDRRAVRVVRAATLLFFDACLKADASAGSQLTAVGLRPYLRGAVNDLSFDSK